MFFSFKKLLNDIHHHQTLTGKNQNGGGRRHFFHK